MKHTVSVLVANRSGVLARIASLFSRRGFNIDSLSVGTTEDPTVSRITIVVEGDDQVLEQVTKQLNKLIDVYKVSDITNDPSIDRDLALIKVKATSSTRSEIMQIVDIFRGKIVDVATGSLVVEVTGNEEKVNAIEELLRPFGIIELVRTGKIAMARGEK
ncbi:MULTISPECIES: acetolactate synthase small subunit [unclassified Candidatus Frackibacter]|uniref:acetolactate synthase small subunit n=1 Tax=unclassified Candidatus Frackibacter TaxID=2648818 RepID=UPI0008805393|nr:MULTISPECIES: acetolactate synthase small subunit [unclassified Candidatus Frackibacter]SDC23086.1 acetolactate synthase, small subunit [Candidatus Frackibacter sp. WG11]SEM48803.1 acetolactate synthase, small subunit [Candidatus Frackibacter sp. WG12]SFL50541.1 acetolactate synthase, small subunit [Candidatus Frackibacter sp. WG13]